MTGSSDFSPALQDRSRGHGAGAARGDEADMQTPHGLTAELAKLLQARESDFLELKASISSAFKAARAMAALANTAGGWLLVGVSDAGEAIGLHDPAAEAALVQEAALHYCDPPLKPAVSTLWQAGRAILMVRVPRAAQPHAVRDQRGRRLVYVRCNDKTLPISAKASRSSQQPATTFSPERLDRHEQKLVQHLRKQERITLPEFMHCANLSRRRAARILTRLEGAGLIRSHDVERRLFYTLNVARLCRGRLPR